MRPKTKQVIDLSVQLAALLGKPVVRPTPQGVLYGRETDVRAMVRESLPEINMAESHRRASGRPNQPTQVPHEEGMDGRSSYLWFKCSEHDTWMQPECKPFDHWKCAVKGCKAVKAAKKRTAIERRIFNQHRWQVAEDERNGY